MASAPAGASPPPSEPPSAPPHWQGAPDWQPQPQPGPQPQPAARTGNSFGAGGSTVSWAVAGRVGLAFIELFPPSDGHAAVPHPRVKPPFGGSVNGRAVVGRTENRASTPPSPQVYSAPGVSDGHSTRAVTPPGRHSTPRRHSTPAASAASAAATNSATCSPVTRYTTRLATDTAWSAKRS